MHNLTFNGRYRILQQIGVGGFGLTYLAEDLRLPTRPKCVVKHLRPQITDAETTVLANRLFQQEAEILYRLGGHPHIPSLIAHFKENGEFFLVQEFIEGHTLDREFQSGRKYNQKEIIQFLGQTLEILAFVHSQKVIHRDLKPANLIRRSADGNIFLIDFGAVKQVSAAPRMPESNAGIAAITIGSHGYMPMEQMAGNPNFSSDLYALGLIAIQALTGIKPLDLPKNGATNEFVWTHKTQLSPELERFIAKLVRFDFRQRFVSANEALASMNAIAANIGFFSQRPQPVGVMTVQPIANQQNPPPAAPPVADPAFVPPTLIVSPNSAPPNNFAGGFQKNAASSSPKKSSGLAGFLTVCGILFFVGFLCVAGKILNFRWSSLGETAQNEPPAARRNNSPSGSSNLSLYGEALKQAQEAAEIEKNATTKFEWEQIASKYKRASALLASIDEKNPNYADAQEKIRLYREKAENAAKQLELVAANSATNSASNSNVSDPKTTAVTDPQYTYPTPAPRRVATMPPPRKGNMYLAYNSSEGDYIGAGKSAVFTDSDGNFYVQLVRKEIHMRFDGGPDTWYLNLAAPQGMKLTAGSYGGAQRCAFHSPTRPGLDFSGSGRGCNRLSGSFNINQVIYDVTETQVLYLDVTFKQQCEESGPPLFGRFHYDARY